MKRGRIRQGHHIQAQECMVMYKKYEKLFYKLLMECIPDDKQMEARIDNVKRRMDEYEALYEACLDENA